tara:strand:+ start:286 stop:951 length:666 start_codon:yes stop_codon:yes gene_type:complete
MVVFVKQNMALSQELLSFVKESLLRGIPRAEIANTLIKAGWPTEQVNQSLSGFADTNFAVPVPRPALSVKPREAFLYVVLFLTLFVSAYNLGFLLFSFINLAFPDPSETGVDQIEFGIRWSLSWLIVTLPVFLYVASLLRRSVRSHPASGSSRIRRQLTYLTLFIASSVLLGDVVGLIFNFLSGDLTVRFVLKVLTVAAIAGGTFSYYLRDLREAEKLPET